MMVKMFRFASPLLLLLSGLMINSPVNGQAPDWMFTLEGTYVGRFEMPASEGGNMRTVDARMDGKRSGAENGFVLQFARNPKMAL